MWLAKRTPLIALAMTTLCVTGCSTVPTESDTATPTAVLSEPSALPAGTADVAALVDSLVGEYDNHEQVVLERRALREGRRESPPHQRVHTIIERVDAPQVGLHVLLLEQYVGGDSSRVFRRQIHRFVDHPQRQAVKHLVFDLQESDRFALDQRTPEDFAALTLDQLIPRPGCEVLWRETSEYLHGSTEPGACTRQAPDGRTLVVSQDIRVFDDRIWWLDSAVDQSNRPAYGPPDGEHQKSRRARVYRGWAGVRSQPGRLGAGSGEWRYSRDLALHNEGGEVALLDQAGAETGYALRLERLGSDSGPIPMLRLSLIDQARGRVVGYAWTTETGPVVGINLGWAQAEMRLAELN